MLAWLLLQVPLTLLPAPARPPECQLDLLPAYVLEERVLDDFNHQVARYVRLHRRLERALPPEHRFGDSEDTAIGVDALHTAIADARPNAQPGTIFTPAVANLLAARLDRAIARQHLTPADVWVAMHLWDPSGLPAPTVNGRFPPVRHVRVWPTLVAVLPALPPELQYRFVGRDLVLLDVHADLVVDILTNALPAPEGAS